VFVVGNGEECLGVLVEFEPAVEELDATEILELELLEFEGILLVEILLFHIHINPFQLRSFQVEISQSDNPALFLRIVVAAQGKYDPRRTDLALDIVPQQ
jgi:hypothetical protein